jgi:hypothetical protein
LATTAEHLTEIKAMLEETFAKLINGQFFVVYRNHASRKKSNLLYKLDGEFMPHQDWLSAKTAAELGA